MDPPAPSPDRRISGRTGPARLRLLGGLELRDAEGRAIELRSRKSRLLLAHLAEPPNRQIARDTLAALLWADRQDEQARGSLRAALSDLRRALGKDAVVIEQDRVSLDPKCVATDCASLRAAAEEDLLELTAIAEIYPGEFLQGIEHDNEPFTDWLRERRAACHDLALRALERAAARQASAGRSSAALDLMRACLALEPLKEASHRAIMQLLAASGERAMALAQYRACRDLLRHELDTEPAAETVALADRIALNDEDSLAELRSAGATAFDQALSRPGARPPVPEPDLPAIAVLPFVNLSGDAEQGYFADGVTEDIITDLSGIDGLSVAASTSSAMYRGRPIRPERIGEELGVTHILEGSVRRSGDAVRITARLADTRASRQVWAERFDRRMANIFELQSEIAAAIVRALRLNLAPGAESVPAARSTRSVEAYQENLRARALMREMTRRSIELARAGFERAIALDPGYAQAHAGLAESIVHLTFHHGTGDWNEAIACAETALRLDDQLAEGYGARAFALSQSGRPDAAEADFETALRLDPKLYEAHYYRSLAYLLFGEPARALPWLRRAFELSDQDLQAGMMLSLCLRQLGLRDEGQAVARHVVAVCRRRFSLNTYDERAAYVMAFALHDLGEDDHARRWARVAAAFEPDDPRATYNIGCIHAVLGEIDTALALLRKTIALGISDQKIAWIHYQDHDWASLRGDARFEELFADPGITGNGASR